MSIARLRFKLALRRARRRRRRGEPVAASAWAAGMAEATAKMAEGIRAVEENTKREEPRR